MSSILQIQILAIQNVYVYKYVCTSFISDYLISLTFFRQNA